LPVLKNESSLSGMNIDASPNSIGKQQHRNFKAAGLVDHKQCHPWNISNKQILKTKYNQEVRYRHWNNAILRTACKITEVSYDS